MYVTILGCGQWGCALASHLEGRNVEITLWGRSQEKIQSLKIRKQHCSEKNSLSNSIFYTNNLEQAIQKADLIIECVTVKALRDILFFIKRCDYKNLLLTSSKGIEKTCKFPIEIIEEIMGQQYAKSILTLSGPNLFFELNDKSYTSSIIACKDLAKAKQISKIFETDFFKTYISPDVLGVQICAAYKQIITVCIGLIASAKNGYNFMAYVLTMGLEEMRNFALKFGCLPHTVYGLSGLGDLIASSLSNRSRNHQFGAYLAQGNSVNDALKRIENYVEGITACKAICKLSHKHNLKSKLAFCLEKLISSNLSASEFLYEIFQ